MHYSQIKTIVLGTENLERWSQHKNDFFNCLAIPITHEPLSSQIASLQKYVTLCKNLESIVGLNDRAILIISLLENNQIQVLDAQTVVQFQHKESFLKLLSKLAIPIMNWQTISSTQEETIQLKFPFFIKPIRGAFSEKTGKIHSLVELKNHFSKYSVNEKIDPTIKKLFMCENTEHLNSYIIQEFVSAPQYTVDFYVRSGKVIIEAITESLIDSHYQSFIGFETPSLLPKECVQDLKNYIQKITTHLALPNAYFNVEFFVKDNQILIIEWNPRLSAQFLKMFEYSLGKNYLQSVLHLGQ